MTLLAPPDVLTNSFVESEPPTLVDMTTEKPHVVHERLLEPKQRQQLHSLARLALQTLPDEQLYSD